MYILKNNSVLPTNQLFVTQVRLSLNFNEGHIFKIIRVLNINKAHGHDDMSIRMIKIYDESILKPLFVLFKNSLNYLITQTFEKNLLSPIPIKIMTSN